MSDLVLTREELAKAIEEHRKIKLRLQGKIRATKHRTKMRSRDQEMSQDEIDDIVFHELKLLINYRTMQYFLKSKVHGVEKRKMELNKIVKEKFDVKVTENMSMVSLQRFLPHVLERYKSHMSKSEANDIRVGIDAVRVGKRSMVTCVVLTLPFLDLSESLKDVSNSKSDQIKSNSDSNHSNHY